MVADSEVLSNPAHRKPHKPAHKQKLAKEYACPPHRHIITDYKLTTTDRKPTPNSTYPKVAIQWLNQALCFFQNLCLVDSEVLRNRHLRQA